MKTGLMSACVQNLNVITNCATFGPQVTGEDMQAIYDWKVCIYEGAEVHRFFRTFNGLGYDNEKELATSLYVDIAEAQVQNNVVDKIIHTADTQFFADALCIGGCVNVFNGNMQVNFQYCCKEKLKERIEEYNSDPKHKNCQVKMESLLDDYNKVLEGNEPSEELYQFAWWLTE